MEFDDWLNDETINDYIKLLNEHANSTGNGVSSNGVYCSDSFLLTLVEKYFRLGLTDKLTKLCKKLRDEAHIESLKRWIIPINVDNIHWILAVIIIPSRMILLYDSFDEKQFHISEYRNMTTVDHIRMLFNMYGVVNNVPLLVNAPWTLLQRKLYHTKQPDFSSCGVFMLTVAEMHVNSQGRTLLHNVDLIKAGSHRKRIMKNLSAKKIITGVDTNNVTCATIMTPSIPLSASRNASTNGRRVMCIHDPLLRPQRDRFLVTAIEKSKSNRILCLSKLDKIQDLSQTEKITNETLFGFSREHMIWTGSPQMLYTIRQSVKTWVGRFVSHRDSHSDMCIVSVVDPTSARWRDPLIFERLILEHIYTAKPNIRVHLCIVYKHASAIYGLGLGNCVHSQDYSPSAFFRVNNLLNKSKETEKPKVSATQSDQSAKKSKLAFSNKSDNFSSSEDEDDDVIEVTKESKETEELTRKMAKGTIADKSTTSDKDNQIPEPLDHVITLNDAIYSLATSFDPNFVDVLLFDSVDDVVSDYVSEAVPTVDLAIVSGDISAVTACNSLRQNVLRNSSGLFLYFDTIHDRNNNMQSMQIHVQKARGVTRTDRVRDMSESSSDDNQPREDAYEDALTDIQKFRLNKIKPLYEEETIKRCIHSITAVEKKHVKNKTVT